MAVDKRISQLPQSPSFSKRPETFDSDGENWAEAIDPMTEEINTMADQINTTQEEINTSEAAAAKFVLDCQAELGNCQTEVQLAKNEVDLASGHANKADDWANAPRNVEIEPGKLSGRHYSETLEDYLDSLLVNPIFSVSETPLDVLKGAKSFVTDPGKNYLENMWLILINKTDPQIWMKGFIDSYNAETGTLVMTVVSVSGEGINNNWLITQTNATVGSFSQFTTDIVWGNQQYINMGGF